MAKNKKILKRIANTLTVLGVPTLSVFLWLILNEQKKLYQDTVASKEAQIELLEKIISSNQESKNAQIEMLEKLQSDHITERFVEAKILWESESKKDRILMKELLIKLDCVGIKYDKLRYVYTNPVKKQLNISPAAFSSYNKSIWDSISGIYNIAIDSIPWVYITADTEHDSLQGWAYRRKLDPKGGVTTWIRVNDSVYVPHYKVIDSLRK